VRGSNVVGRRLSGPAQGFGQLRHKTYSVDVGAGVTMSTGVFVLYADAESFTFATPRGTSSRASCRP
jgi:hypothetical protein